MIEKACGGSLTIDSQSGDVSISWEGEPDPIKRMKVPDVISAIGRGFSPSARCSSSRTTSSSGCTTSGSGWAGSPTRPGGCGAG